MPIGDCETLLRSPPIPPYGFRIILLDTFALLVHGAENHLGIGITLLRSLSHPRGGFYRVPRDPVAVVSSLSHFELRLGVLQFCFRQNRFRRLERFKVAGPVMPQERSVV